MRDITKRKAVFLYAKNFNADFCLIQETHSIDKDYNFWKSQWGEDLWMSHGSQRSAGTLILKHKFNGKILFTQADPLGHYTLMVFSHYNQLFLLGNVYGYNNAKENADLFEMLTSNIDALSERFSGMKIILGGDFNATINDSFDRWPNRNKENSTLIDFMNETGLTDVWRINNPNSKEFTWKNNSGSLQSRIDFWLVSESLPHTCCKADIIPTPLTDHKAIILNVNGPSNNMNKRTPAYWKLNNSLLLNESLNTVIKNKIDDYLKMAQREGAYGKYWELLKFELRKLLMQAGANIMKDRKKNENSLMTELISLSSVMPDDMSENQRAQLQTLQLKLDQLYISKAKGAFIRSRAKWMEEGEQNSSYFFKLEKHRQNRNGITRLSLNGTIVDNPKDIAEMCENFYKALYESKLSLPELEDFFDSLGENRKIGEVNKTICDSPITISEIKDAIKKLKLNKSPGVDGLTSEFYKLFSAELAPFLLNVSIESFNNEVLPPSLCQSLITLIPKPQKDVLLLDNWRPISLLTNDYKIIALCLANKLKQVLNDIID